MSEAEEAAVGAVDNGVDDVRQRARAYFRLKQSKGTFKPTVSVMTPQEAVSPKGMQKTKGAPSLKRRQAGVIWKNYLPHRLSPLRKVTSPSGC